jgi:hypothetical protein
MRLASKLPLALLAGSMASWGAPVLAASHREAPLIAMDPAADNTDVYAFVSYDAANLARASTDRRVTFIMNVNPGQDPSDGPNYFNFADDVRYVINIDNNQDGKADDIVYEFRFTTENRPVGGPGGLTSPVPYLGNPHIPPVVPLQGITALDGPGSEGLTAPDLYRDRGPPREPHPAVRRPQADCGTLQRRASYDAQLSGPSRAGHLQ